MAQSKYTVINASAGSGKTYALVQRLLKICLKYPDQPQSIRQILALTFTNKAANEMKERILSWLQKFSDQAKYADNNDLIGIKDALAKEGTHVSLEELHKRSQKILDYVLHNYSTLNIGTIDKFNAKLVRSFSYELGLAQNFNLEINAEPFLLEAVDKMLDEIGNNQTVSKVFMDYVIYYLDNSKKVNLNQTLYKSAKEFVQDKHYFWLDKNREFGWNEYEKEKQRIQDNIKDTKKETIAIIQNSIKLIEDNNLTPSDFAGGNGSGLGKFFYEVRKFFNKERDKFPFPADEESAYERFKSGASTTAKKKADVVEAILPDLLSAREKIINNYISTQKQEKILKSILPLKVNKDIQDKLAEIEEENDLVLLPKFNVMIHENLRAEPSSFIYEKVGTQFSHYFFDEFQDTSTLQWQNFLPLRDHTISSDHMSFTMVGDPKQSIYRFRGGDSELMLNIINKKEESNPPVDVIVDNLEFNWRSGRNIVAFNNELYSFLSKQNIDEHRAIFGNGSQQTAKSDFDGRVRINLIDNLKKEEFYKEASEKMQTDIQSCLDQGFRFSDITILCRNNKEIFNYSQLLGSLKVTISNEYTYIKTISEAGLTLNLSNTLLALTEFLRWEQNPKNTQFLVKMMYFLKISGRIEMQDFTKEIIEILSKNSRSEIRNFILDKYGLNLHKENVLQLNLYNFIETYLHEFSVKNKETDFLLNYLEMLHAYSQNSGATLKDFLKFWDEEGGETSIQQSENVDAIQLMTIHKSKGLEFPVVFLPMENENKDKKFTSWLQIDSEENMSAVNIDAFAENLERYDTEMQTFNQENIYKNKIDRFCLQYVATTRAVAQMFFYIEKPSKTNHLEIFDFIKAHIPIDETGAPLSSFDFFPVDIAKLTKQKGKDENSKFKSKKIQFIDRETENSDAITIATPSKNYQNRVESVRIGIFTHEILSRIQSEKDIEQVLESYVLEGTITEEEKVEIAKRISAVVQNPLYKNYFSEENRIINERDVMISENGNSVLVRPDRIIETSDGFYIIDFKTGEEKEKHEQQLENYKNVLEKTGRKVIGTDIIYV